jgi:hypothetical protein
MRKFLAIAFLVAACTPAAAAADGGIGAMAAPGGVSASGSPYRYVALQPRVAGAPVPPTVIERIAVDGGKIDRWWSLKGQYYVPAVAYDGSGGGLSADGGTLLLTELPHRFPPQRSGFAVLDTNLQLRHPLRPGERRPKHAVTRFSLPGSYSFDAISPNGETVYLVHYLLSRGPVAYEVRAFDLADGRLLPEPIVDPEEAGEKMQGLPVTRAMSPDGRWAYTLYDGNGGEPFLHALDTVRGRAVCVDLPQLEGRKDLFGSALRIDAAGEELAVLSRATFARRPLDLRHAQPLLTIDTGSFEVQRPSVAAEPRNDSLPWLPIGIAAAALAAALLWIVSRRQRLAGRRPLEQG